MTRICLALLLVATLAGQTFRGQIVGRTAPSATITVTSTDTAAARTVTAGLDGRFTVPSLSPGEYRLDVSAAGFSPQSRTVTLGVNQEIDISMPMVSTSERHEVEVRDTAPLLRSDAVSGGWIANQQVVDLPLDGRNYYELSLLLPGVLPPAQGSAGSVRGDFAININGSREDGNLFLLDGVYNGDPKLNGVGLTSPVDGIREFEVAAANYDASFGRNAGGQVNVVMKSGGNRLHGTAYHFFRNDALDARNFFAPAGESDPKYRRNQFGFSLGGPIVKDRTFFFGDYEGRRTRQGLPRLTRVPTALERNGDFSQSGLPYIIDPFTQQPFPDNKIPDYRIHPVGRSLAALYPLPNRAGSQNYVSSPVLLDDSDNFDVRLDHRLSEKSELMGRYSFADRSLFEPFAGPSFAQVPGYGTNVPRRAQNAVIGYTRVFTPSLINELRLGYNRVSIGVFQENINNNLNSQVGLPVLSGNPRDTGLTFVSVLGYSPLGDEYNNPQSSSSNTYQVLNTATWTQGATLWKFGGEIRKFDQRAYRDVQSRGLIQFVGFTGSALAEMLQGLPAATAGATLDNPQNLRGESYALFAQMNRRVRENLTINLGLRYEYNSPPVDPNDRAYVYDPISHGLAQVGTNGVPRAGYHSDRNNFGPRIGIAWSPGESRKTVLRGGYGFYFDQSALAPSEGMYFTPPYFNFRLFVTSQAYLLTLSNPFPSDYPYQIPGSAFSFDPGIRTPYVQHWNFHVQRSLSSSTVAEVGYVGTKGTRLLSARDINQPAPGTLPNNGMRPDPRFDDINQLESRANSSWHSLQASLRRSLSHGVSLVSSYTLGKSIDDASNFFPSAGDANFPQDSRNASLEKARSNFDVRQRFTAGFSWLIPCPMKSRARWILAGWQTNGIVTLQSGRPFTVALPQEMDNSGTGRSSLGFGANDRPNIVGDPFLDSRTPERWFNTSAFAIPQYGTFGNAGRNILDGPGLASLNLSVMKNINFGDGLTAQLRAEAFNALNRTNFDQPQNFVGGAGFGSISSAQNPRLIQLGLKLLF